MTFLTFPRSLIFTVKAPSAARLASSPVFSAALSWPSTSSHATLSSPSSLLLSAKLVNSAA